MDHEVFKFFGRVCGVLRHQYKKKPTTGQSNTPAVGLFRMLAY